MEKKKKMRQRREKVEWSVKEGQTVILNKGHIEKEDLSKAGRREGHCVRETERARTRTIFKGKITKLCRFCLWKIQSADNHLSMCPCVFG